VLCAWALKADRQAHANAERRKVKGNFFIDFFQTRTSTRYQLPRWCEHLIALESAIALLAGIRADGATFITFPKPELQWFVIKADFFSGVAPVKKPSTYRCGGSIS
jgi:hypothetical protein